MSTTATTAKHRAGAPPRRDQAGSRHPSPRCGAGPRGPPALHPLAKGTWVPGSCPPAPPAGITPPLLQAPTSGAGVTWWSPCHAWGTCGDISMWVPGSRGPPSRRLPGTGGCPEDVGARDRYVPGGKGWVGGCRRRGCPDLGWPEQGVSGRAWCGPCPTRQARAKGSALACRSYSRSSGGFQKKLPLAISGWALTHPWLDAGGCTSTCRSRPPPRHRAPGKALLLSPSLSAPWTPRRSREPQGASPEPVPAPLWDAFTPLLGSRLCPFPHPLAAQSGGAVQALLREAFPGMQGGSVDGQPELSPAGRG